MLTQSAAFDHRARRAFSSPPSGSAWGVILCALLAALGCQEETGDGPTWMGVDTDSTGGSQAAPVPGDTTSTPGPGIGPVAPTNTAGSAPAGTGNPSPEGTTPTAEQSCDEPAVPRAPLRRITRFEYNNSVRDLLGITTRPADALPGEEAGSGFGNDADALGVSRLLIDGYRTVAKQIAEQVTVDLDAMIGITGCDPATGENECRQSFLDAYLKRTFRRPPDALERAAYEDAFAQGQELGGGFASGVRAVVERSLQAPQFLYRLELGQPLAARTDLARPTGYEMATRLSYVLWASTPDTALLDAAEQGLLETADGVLTQARHMLKDDKAKDSLRQFHGLLFGTSGLNYLERDAGYYPTFKPGMGSLFRQETERFLDYVVWEGWGDLATAFTAPYTFVNEELANFYGIPGVTGEDFVKVSLSEQPHRAGLFTQASILTLTTPGSRTDPVVRGKWLYTKMLCGSIPDPPPDIPPLPEPVPGQSVRERLAQHRAAPACAGCHQLMDPLGLPFEHYDGVGLWRDTDSGAEIDTTGAIPISDVAGPFDGVIEFSQRLAESEDVRACYADRFLTFAYGRALDGDDACSRSKAITAFQKAQGNIQELLLAVTQTDGFLLRTPVAPEQSGDPSL